jgi:hypothetical protein
LYLKNDVEEMPGEKELHDAILELHVCAMRDFSLWPRAQKIAGHTTRELLRESLTLLIVRKNLKKYGSPGKVFEPAADEACPEKT